MVQNHPRPHAHGPPLRVEVADLAVVPREINHQPIADGPAYQPGPGAARSDRDARLRRRLDNRAGLPRVAGKRHSHRFDLVDRGVSRVELAGKVIEGDVTARAGQRRLLLS